MGTSGCDGGGGGEKLVVLSGCDKGERKEVRQREGGRDRHY